MIKLPSRVWTIILAAIVITSLLILASSLNALELAEGKPLPANQLAPELPSSDSSADMSRIMLAIIRVGMIIFWVLLPFFIISLIISKEARKRFIRDVMTLLPIILLLYWLTSSNVAREQSEELESRFGMNQSQAEAPGELPPAMPEFQPPPDWVTIFTSLVLALVVTAIVVFVIYTIWRRTRRKEDEPLQQIERQAQDALNAIAAGGDLREVIQRCYFQMIDALREYRNIQRDRDVTPHEFELFLQRRGLPSDPVHQLTALFEQVRYGAHEPGRQDERLAISSLSAIVSACRHARDAEGRS